MIICKLIQHDGGGKYLPCDLIPPWLSYLLWFLIVTILWNYYLQKPQETMISPFPQCGFWYFSKYCMQKTQKQTYHPMLPTEYSIMHFWILPIAHIFFESTVLDVPQNKGAGLLWNSLHELFPYQALTKIHCMSSFCDNLLWLLLALQWFLKSIYFYCWT